MRRPACALAAALALFAGVLAEQPRAAMRVEQALNVSDLLPFAQFGYAVSINRDGAARTVLIGAFHRPGAAGSVGAAYIFSTTADQSTWSLAANLTSNDSMFLGTTVALNGDASMALVGSYGNWPSGAAYAFNRTSGSNDWALAAKLLPRDDTNATDFGGAVALCSSTEMALIGAPLANAGAGAVYVYNTSTWQVIQKLRGNDSVLGDAFGVPLSVSDNCGVMLVGAAGRNRSVGAAYFFGWNGSHWLQVATVMPPQGSTSSDQFGASVALSGDGTTACVGAPQSSFANGTLQAGAAYVYSYSAAGAPPAHAAATAVSHTAAAAWQLRGQLMGPDPTPAANFGYRVSVNRNGSYVLVAAPYESLGLRIGGAVYLFAFRSAQAEWALVANLTAADIGTDAMGSAVALSSGGGSDMLAVVGASTHANDAGDAFIVTIE